MRFGVRGLDVKQTQYRKLTNGLYTLLSRPHLDPRLSTPREFANPAFQDSTISLVSSTTTNTNDTTDQSRHGKKAEQNNRSVKTIKGILDALGVVIRHACIADTFLDERNGDAPATSAIEESSIGTASPFLSWISEASVSQLRKLTSLATKYLNERAKLPPNTSFRVVIQGGFSFNATNQEDFLRRGKGFMSFLTKQHV